MAAKVPARLCLGFKMSHRIAYHPIAVFDSGVGGLSVLKEIHTLLPAEKLIYFADHAYMPYGCKREDAVKARCLQLGRFFASLPVKAIVVACNTATAVAVRDLRAALQVPIIGMEPALKPAVGHSRGGVVGVLATSGTVASRKFQQLKASFAKDSELLVQPCPGLVEQIESGHLESAETLQMLKVFLEPLLTKGVDTLVLGCSHYPLLLPMIRKVVGDEMAVVDTGDALARQLRYQLHQRQTLAPLVQAGVIRFMSSMQGREQLISSLWGEAVSVEFIDMSTAWDEGFPTP